MENPRGGLGLGGMWLPETAPPSRRLPVPGGAWKEGEPKHSHGEGLPSPCVCGSGSRASRGAGEVSWGCFPRRRALPGSGLGFTRQPSRPCPPCAPLTSHSPQEALGKGGLSILG